jgi:hypothetical protein
MVAMLPHGSAGHVRRTRLHHPGLTHV